VTRAAPAIAAAALGLAACGSCGKGDATAALDASSPAASTGPGTSGGPAAPVVAELLPRCRGDAARLVIAGEDVIVGDVAVGPTGLLVGLIRTEGGRRTAAVMRASLDLATSRIFEVGPSLGDDPPPSPRWSGAAAWVTSLGREGGDGGPKLRALRLARLEDAGLAKVAATILQQADESTAYDVAWGDGDVALAAWDEDAPPRRDASSPEQAERGFVKVQVATGDGRPRVASPEASDAESPRLIARPGGFWLAWLARRAEEEAYAIEGPGERRAFRWVEAVPLDAHGEAAGPVRRVSPEKGRAVAFELARHGGDLVVIVQDEVAPSEGAGARVVRYHVPDGRATPVDLVDGGIGHALAELVPMGAASGESARWLAWNDTAERAHLTPLGEGLVATGRASPEPALDRARVLAGAPPDALYALVAAPDGEGTARPAAATPPELRRFTCK
jgi:hypothetical protein